MESTKRATEKEAYMKTYYIILILLILFIEGCTEKQDNLPDTPLFYEPNGTIAYQSITQNAFKTTVYCFYNPELINSATNKEVPEACMVKFTLNDTNTFPKTYAYIFSERCFNRKCDNAELFIRTAT